MALVSNHVPLSQHERGGVRARARASWAWRRGVDTPPPHPHPSNLNIKSKLERPTAPGWRHACLQQLRRRFATAGDRTYRFIACKSTLPAEIETLLDHPPVPTIKSSALAEWSCVECQHSKLRKRPPRLAHAVGKSGHDAFVAVRTPACAECSIAPSAPRENRCISPSLSVATSGAMAWI